MKLMGGFGGRREMGLERGSLRDTLMAESGRWLRLCFERV